jgi:asparagine synthase (glutamine-hydrolysing)
MSDIFITNLPDLNVKKVQDYLSWTTDHVFYNKNMLGGVQFIQSHLSQPNYWRYSTSVEVGLTCLVAGRLVLDSATENMLDEFPSNFSITKFFLDKWITQDKNKFSDVINGAGIVFIYDETSKKLYFWTDCLGFYPIYFWSGGDKFIISSNADLMAEILDDYSISLQIDKHTIAEFLMTGTASQPYTYWTDICQLDSGMFYELKVNRSELSKRKYWQPPFLSGQTYISKKIDAVDYLTDVLRKSIHRRTGKSSGNVGVMLSAGADSRLALFASRYPDRVSCFTFYDDVNSELLGAQQIAGIANARHITYRRDKDYYFSNAVNAIKHSGGMWSIDSAHYGAVGRLVKENNIGVLLTGCYADYLLKGLAYNRSNKKVFGKEIPLYNLDKFCYEWYQPFLDVSDSYKNSIYERLEKSYKRHGAFTDDPYYQQSMAEYCRLTPIIREADSIGRHTLRCTAPHDFFTADRDVLNCAFSLHPDLKKNGIIFGQAVANITGQECNRIWNNNYHAPVNAGQMERVILYVFDSLRRKIMMDSGQMPHEKYDDSVGTFGSWPYFSKAILLSSTIEMWSKQIDPMINQYLQEILSEKYKSMTLNDWSKNIFMFLRYYTAYSWLSKNKKYIK